MTVRLFLTPTRRALLMAVERGEVHRYGDGHDYVLGWKKCDQALDLMRRNDWVYLGAPMGTVANGSGHKVPWVLTDAGKAVLAHG